MELCLVRHGIAVERGTGGFERDELRPLTAEGRTKMTQAAAGLGRLFRPEAVFSSPLVRAWQTAEILGRQWKLAPREMVALAEGDHAGTLNTLAAAGLTRAVLVGHEPWMSELLALLVSGERSGLTCTTFKKGGAALVSGDAFRAGAWALEWFLPPSILRRLT